MNTIRILARNLADAAYSTITASPAMVSTSLAETNLQRPTERAKTARTSSTAVQRFVLDFLTAGQQANMVAFSRHNWSTAATLRSRLQDAAGSPSNTVLDTGALPAWSTAGLDTLLDVYTEVDFLPLKNSVQYFATTSNLGEAILDIADAGNAAGYIEQNRLWVGKYFQFTYDPPFGGVDLTPMDMSVMSRADDGTQAVNKKWLARKLVLQLQFIPDADLPSVLAIARFLGKYRECWLDVYPDDTGAKGIYHRGAFRLTDSPTFNPHQVGLHKNTMTFEET